MISKSLKSHLYETTDCMIAEGVRGCQRVFVCICSDLNLKNNKSLKKGRLQLVCHYC